MHVDIPVSYTHLTIYETIIGFVSGTIFGTIIAIVLWWSDFLAKVVDPYLVVLNALPKTALGPVILVWIGGTTDVYKRQVEILPNALAGITSPLLL